MDVAPPFLKPKEFLKYSIFTLTLHKLLSCDIADMLETVAFSGQMLDAGYLMLDTYQCTNDEINKHLVSRNQDPGSANTRNGFHRNGQV